MQVKLGNVGEQALNTSLQTQEKAGESGRRSAAVKRINTIFAGDLPLHKDSITIRRQQAQKRAMQFVKDAWAGDRKLDQSRDEILAKKLQQQEEARLNQEQAQVNTDRIENLRQQYGVEEDSQEQKDLDLLIKAANDESLTEDEEARLEEMGPQREYLALLTVKMRSTEPFSGEDEARLNELGGSLTEYQRNCLEINSERSVYEKRAESAQNYADALQSSLTDMKIERLKYHKMTDAQNKAKKEMEQAGEEIQGMLVDAAKDHIDESYEEKREAAEKKAEEKEAQEEKIELRKEQRELMEARIEAAQEENSNAEEAGKERERDAREEASFLKDMAEAGLDVAGAGAAVQAEIKDMLNKMKLIEADIKGIEVDEEI
ncbi:MAG: hypothetical protein NC302_13545 [Bacteroidales bacterium]|nr:hypothetical protein [Bacteroidales bacterium]MCM1417114.1 hypothetical protein [bacterium]MCM1424942.1 hypothetical protein [bacterium]